MDAGTGEILIEKGADEKRQIASVTKLMTMLLVMEAIEDGRVKLTDEVVATPHACSYGGSQIYLEPGERFTVQEMLMAVTIKSANDAAIALSEHVAGSEAAFVALMNKRSEELGMQNTHFINACGLDDVSVSGNSGEKGYSSARDVAIMSRAVLKYHPMLKEWFKTRITYLQRAKGPVELFNTNYRFIGNFQGADGLKTGLTDDAGWCLSATAERNGFRLIAVALGAPTDELRYQDVAAMLNYGFANFTGQTVVKAGEVMGEVVVNRGQQPTLNVVAKNNLAVLLKKGESLDDLEKLIELPPKVFAPVGAGQALGEMQLVKDGKVLGRIELIAATDVQRLGFFGNLGRLLQGLFR
jgi:D-alanyl-D-alanine carboxypeptidase (penicillin-binding protein 5/6)